MATDKTKTWESDEKFAALAVYRGAAAASGGAGADAGGEGGEKKLSKNALKKLAKGKVCCCLLVACRASANFCRDDYTAASSHIGMPSYLGTHCSQFF